jgi:hypothetical protein
MVLAFDPTGYPPEKVPDYRAASQPQMKCGRLEVYAVFPDGKVKLGLEREVSESPTAPQSGARIPAIPAPPIRPGNRVTQLPKKASKDAPPPATPPAAPGSFDTIGT